MANETDFLEGWEEPVAGAEVNYLEGWAEPERQGVAYEDRGFFSDIMHSALQGLADTAKLSGQGLEQFTGIDTGLESLGRAIEKSEFARPDYPEAMGLQGRLKGILQQGVRAAPNMIPAIVASGAVVLSGGSLALAGSAAALSSFVPMAGGVYAQMRDRLDIEKPDMSEEEKHNVAFREAAYEWVPEAVGNIALLGAGKAAIGLGKSFFKDGAKFLVENGSMKVDDIFKGAMKGKTVKQIAGAMVGAGSVEGSTEVATAFLQEANQERSGLDVHGANKVDLFFASMIPGTAMGVIGAGQGLKAARKIKDNVEKGLGSYDLDQRVYTVNTVSDQIATKDSEFAEAFRTNMLKRVVEGPQSLETLIMQETKVDDEFTKITEAPEVIMEKAGIPAGVADETKLRAEDLSGTFKEELVAEDLRYGKQETPEEVAEGIVKEEAQRVALKAEQERDGLVIKDYMNVTQPIVDPLDYESFKEESRRLQVALDLEDARSKAIRSGMEKVLVDTNKLAEVIDLDERATLAKGIEKTQLQILAEVEKVSPKKEVAKAPVAPKVVAPKKPKVAAVAPVVPKAVPVAPKVVKPVEVVPEAPKVAVAPKAVVVPKAIVAPKVAVVKPAITKAPKIEGLKRKTYEEQLLVTKGLEDRLAKAQATKGTPEKVAEARDLVKTLAPQAIAARKHLQTLKKPVVKEVFKSKKEAKEAVKLKEPEKLSEADLKKAQEVQDLGVSIAPETQMLLKEHRGTAKEFVKSLETPQQIKSVGIGKGRTISFHEGTTIEYQGDKEKASKRWLVRQGTLTKRVASEPLARKAIASGTVAELKDFEDVGKVAADIRKQAPMSSSAKKEVDKFYKENDPKDFGAPSDVALATSVLAKAGKLYDTNGILERDLLKKAVKSAKNVMEGKSTESKQAAKAGIVSGTTEQTELSTEEAILMPIAKEVKPKAEVAPVVTIEAGEALKAEYLARHKENMKKTQKMTQVEFIGKRVAEPDAAKAILDGPENILRDEALYADPDVISWRKNVEPSITEEQLEAIDNDWMEPNDYNPLLAFQAFDKQYPGIPIDTDLANTKMQLRSYVFQEGRVMQNFFSNTYKNASELLDGVIAQGSKEEVALATFIKKSPKIDKLLSIPVLGTNGSSFFTSREGGKILMSSSAMLRPSIWLHEIQHAATSQEIVSNEKMAEEVQIMMRNLRNASGLDRMQLKAVDAANGDGSKFNDIARAYSEWSDDQLQVAYALVNEREFLAQAYSSKHVRDLMRTTRHTGFDGIKTSIWQRVKDFFTEIMQLPKGYDSVLEAVLRTSGRLYRTSAVTGIETLDFSFGGLRSETSPAISKAYEMEKDGATAESILEETSWYQDDRGAWRYEIDDSDMKVATRGDGYWKLKDLIDHKELFKAYPKLKNVEVFTKHSELKKGQGAYRTNGMGKQEIRIGQSIEDREGLKEVLIHEIQHAIQEIEGATRGGQVVEQAAQVQPSRINVMAYEIKSYIDKNPDATTKDIRDYTASYDKTYLDIDQYTDSQVDEAISLASSKTRAQLDKLPRKSLSAYEIYKAIPGEVEASNTADRIMRTAEWRRKNLPANTYVKPSADMKTYEPENYDWDSWSYSVAEETTDRRKETLDEATRRVLEERKETNRYKEKVWEKGGQALSTFKKLAEPISDTLMRISKPLHAKLMSMEARQMLKGTEYRDGITPFLKYYKGLTDSQKTRLDIGLLNNNELVWNEMPKDVRMALETVLGDASDRSIDVGLLTEKKKLYFPRRVKDIQGLSDYLMRDLDEKGPLGMALQKKATELGMEITDLPQPVRNQVVTDMLSSGEIMQLPRPGSTKQRTIGKVTSDLVPFYETSSSALLAHIYDVNDKVSLREFVGGSARKAKVRALMSLNTKIDKETDAGKKALLERQWKADASELQNLELDLDEGIQALIDKELSSKSAAEQTEVLSLLSARMRQKGASGIADTARNIGYMATMGNFLSAITQFGDIPIVFYRYGINIDTISSIGEAFKAIGSIAKGEITGKTAVTDAFVGSMDFTNALREFTSGDNISGKALDVVFKYSGLKYADLVGKEAAMRASFKFYQNPKNKQKFMDKFENFFEKPEEVLQKIQMGNRKDADVLTALFAELSDFQPISLSQQSEAYLGAGNMRMFYALKTFTLRTTSAAIREGMMDMKKGDKKSIAKGTAKIASIIMIYALAGAGADELKDLLRGKTSSVTDNTADNVLQMFFLSKYTLEKGMQKDQVIQGIISNLLPPVRYADNFIADVAGLVSEDKEFKFKSLAVVPVIGTLIQARTSPQQASYASQERAAILEDVKANKKRRKGARDGGITERVREYNKKIKDKTLKISDRTIMSAYRR